MMDNNKKIITTITFTFITKYLESNTDSLLDLAEKNYQNLVDAFKNNARSSAAASSSTSSNPTLSSRFSSLTFNLCPYDQVIYTE
jgi:hypothetical protein